MTNAFLPLLIILLVIAALMRDDFALTLIYLVVGAALLGIGWSRYALARVAHRRSFNEHAFLGEKVEIDLQVHNRGWLPVLWLSLHDSLPVALSTNPSFQHVFSLGPRTETRFKYLVHASKRGYYEIGPLSLAGGDILGLGKPLRLESPARHLTVYPKIIPLSAVQIPSRSPQGTLRHHQPIFEDPTRIFGKRDYIAGDSLRRVDWKSTAVSGRLQVKLFEPSISLETLIFLDLNRAGYHYRSYIDSAELAIVIAASLAAWVAGKQQTVGLKINGRDPLAADGLPEYLPPRKGEAHLMHMLETLARVELVDGSPLPELIQQQRYHLSWGTTLMVVTGKANQPLLNELHQARRSGQNAVLVLAGPAASHDTAHRAAFFGIPVVYIRNERGLDIWRK